MNGRSPKLATRGYLVPLLSLAGLLLLFTTLVLFQRPSEDMRGASPSETMPIQQDTRTPPGGRAPQTALSGRQPDRGRPAGVPPLARARKTESVVQELVGDSATIFVGRVTSLNSEWTGDRAQIWTNITFSVEEYLKGALPGKTLTLKQLGGTVGDITLSISGAPEWRKGERVLVFARPGYIPVAGMSRGKASLDGTRVSGGSEGLPSSLRTLRRQIQSAVRAQQSAPGGGETP